MQRTLVLLAMLTAAAANLEAQKSWQTEFGLQTGFTRLVSAGSGADPTDAISLPGFNLGNALPSPAGLYAVFPWSMKLALETDVAASQFSAPGGTATFFGIGLRGDYAVTKGVYVAAGGALVYNNGLANATQMGVQGALGYRFRLTRVLRARLEGRTTFFGSADNAGPVDIYSLLFGVSTVTGGGSTSRRASPAANRAWRPQIGINGGYVDAHLIGIGSLTSLSMPGYGGGLGNALANASGGLVPILHAFVLPPTLFAIIPVGAKVAIEPGLDVHRLQTSGQTDFSSNLSVRVDYAVQNGWYGALGGNLHYIKTSGVDATTRLGLNVGWGYRFPLVLGVAGRIETNYTWFRNNADLGLPAMNVFGLMFGAAIPIK